MIYIVLVLLREFLYLDCCRVVIEIWNYSCIHYTMIIFYVRFKSLNNYLHIIVCRYLYVYTSCHAVKNLLLLHYNHAEYIHSRIFSPFRYNISFCLY